MTQPIEPCPSCGDTVDGAGAPVVPPVDPQRAELVAALRAFADLIATRPDLEIPKHTMQIRMVVQTRAGLEAWAAQYDATVQYLPTDGARVIPNFDHYAGLLAVHVQSRAEPDPAVVDKDARIAELETALAAAKAQAMGGEIPDLGDVPAIVDGTYGGAR